MTLKEVAAYLRVTEKTIHRLLEKGVIPAIRVGRLWRFDSEALDRWLQEKSKFTKARILVVDDEESIRALVKATVEELGHEVITAKSGTMGLNLIKKQDFNLLFLDLKMPGMDGAELFRRIKEVKPELPVVIITGHPESDLMSRALAYGPFSIMNKPFRPSDITQIVSSFIRINK